MTTLVELGQPDQDGNRMVLCKQCGYQRHTHWPLNQIHHNCEYAVPNELVGTELKKMFQEWAVVPSGDCGCDALASEMDFLGIAGCKAKRNYLIVELGKSAKTQTLLEKVALGAKLIREPWFKANDQIGSILDEAIRRVAEQR